MTAHHFQPSGPLTGRIRVPGDKSISHRALMFGALAVGQSRIAGLLEGEDVLATAAALRAMGARIAKEGDAWVIDGVGVGSLLQPGRALDMGNSGTSTRLLMGLLASHGITAAFTGDASLSQRPMGRVIEPLAQMGASFTASPGATLPLMMEGMQPAVPIAYRLPVASAQVKSAVLLAGLNTPGMTTVIEPVPTRDHTERMLRGFGVAVEVDEAEGERRIRVDGPCDLTPCDIEVPGDPSSAAFFAVAATIVPGSDLVIENVGLNPTRDGIFRVLAQMGADIELRDRREVGGEPVADLRVRHARLGGIAVDPAIAPSMIDEFPILFVAAALAEGTTVTRGLEELRVKESDRLAAMAAALACAGAAVEETQDGLIIHGTAGEPLRGTANGRIRTHLDHRIAMSMAVAGSASRDGVEIDSIDPIATSFPNFMELLARQAVAPPPLRRTTRNDRRRGRFRHSGRLWRDGLHHRRLWLSHVEERARSFPAPRHQPSRRRAADRLAAGPHQLAEPGAGRFLGSDCPVGLGQGDTRAQKRTMIIAVDGPTASGKGTIAKALADHFGLPHLDTGLLYRAVGRQVFFDGGDPDDSGDALAGCAFPDELLLDPLLRDEETGGLASRVSVHRPVRQALFDRQRRFALQEGGAVLDGRDIGTVIAPEAEAKLFVTASVEARAQRRFLEMRERGVQVTLLEIADDLRRRDERDRSRAVAPLVPAPDAMVIDTSALEREEAIAAAIEAVEGALRG